MHRTPGRRILAPFLALLTLTGIACTGPPRGVSPVSGFELERYLGTWYEIARLDHRFERGLTDVTATYAPRDGGGITVLNRGYDPEADAWREARGKAFFVDDPSEGVLEVSFFGPFYGGYNVIALDPDYRWSLVAGPTRSYLWILARTPQLPEAVFDRLVEQARGLGFPVDELIRVSHSRAEPAAPDED